MNLYSRIFAGVAIALLLLDVSPAASQGAKPEKRASENSASSPQAPEEKAPAATPEDSAVEAILATKPTTPDECARAAKILADLGRPELAKDFLKKILAAKLDAQQLADLGEQLGTVVFLEMSNQAALRPEAEKIYKAVATALAKRLENADRIAKLIRQLQDPSDEKRLQAVVGLQQARDAAIRALVQVLADANRSAEHAAVRAALVEMGPSAREALVVLTDRVDPKLAVQVIVTLGEMRDSRATLALLGPCLSEKSDPAVRAAAALALKRLAGDVPTRAVAVGRLTEAARAYLERRQLMENEVGGRVSLWRWDANRRRCAATRVAADEAARVWAARWARDAFAIAPDDREVRLLYLTTLLEAMAHRNGLDRPFDEQIYKNEIQEVKRLGIAALDATLDDAMARGHVAAATAAARLLGQFGDAEGLLYQNAKPSPLTRAARSSDRRLQLAAVEAVVRMAPNRPFAGASYVLDALGFLAAGRGTRGALVAFPNARDARDIAGWLTAAGYRVDTFFNGRDVLFQAAKSPDYELAMIDATIGGPTVEILLQQMRHDPRTASLRVGVIARDGYGGRAEHAAENDLRSRAFARPRDEAAVRWQLEQLAAMSPSEFVPADVRRKQAERALELLAAIGRSSGRLYDLRRVQQPVLDALSHPQLSAKAAAVLAVTNSAEAQRALVELVGHAAFSTFAREAAVRAFRENVERYGVLLTATEIRRQYDVLHATDKQDIDTRRMLGLVLDSIEASSPAKTNVPNGLMK